MFIIFKRSYILKNCRFFSRKFPVKSKVLKPKIPEKPEPWRKEWYEKFIETSKPHKNALQVYITIRHNPKLKAFRGMMYPWALFIASAISLSGLIGVCSYFYSQYLMRSKKAINQEIPMPYTMLVKENFIPESRPKERFSDVIGLEDFIDELNFLIDYYKNQKKFQVANAKMPKGILLTGETGTGKTLLANAIAGEAGVSYFKISASEFDEVNVGSGAKKMRDLFIAAKKTQPSIIFIDEISSIAEEIYEINVGESKQTVIRLMHEIDRAADNDKILVIAASNSSEALDSRLIRTGRFDWKINIPVPDRETRKKIIKHTLAKQSLKFEIDAEEIARQTAGFTPLQLFQILNSATTHVTKNNTFFLSSTDILNEIRKINKISRLTKEEKLQLAVHEIGIFLMYLKKHENVPLEDVSLSLNPSSKNLTELFEVYQNTTRKEILDQVDILISGKAALDLVYGKNKRINDLCEEDIMKTRKYLNEYVRSGLFNGESGFVFYFPRKSRGSRRLVQYEVNRLIKKSHKKSLKYMQKDRALLMQLAEILIEKENISGKELKEIIRKAR
ncbi:unnamed protein product [Blepharisma stoltei]|uniref:AAA+ ATPase domain-containing protein n=1 Tax=Blepharisma stoltei TaxID=1481888 RepID=A0AAU9JNP1_9CILI|nr:unnamed protein product [Blepharisma stoltei]